jgi:hypothetical protein
MSKLLKRGGTICDLLASLIEIVRWDQNMLIILWR